MAEIQYGDVGVEAPALNSAKLAGLVNWLGALVSVTLIAGLAFWGYQLMVRDVSGVPVVRALEGPMRVAPEDPGGASAQYQGLAVNNIAAVGEAEAPAERLVLAPKPTVVGGQDPTVAALDTLQSTVGTETVAVAPQETVTPAVPASPDATSQDNAVTTSQTAAPVQEPATDQASLIDAALREAGGSASVATEALHDGAIASDVAGVSTSMRPLARPETVTASAATAIVPVAAAGDQVKSLNPADLPAGTRLAQLGAFDSVAIAKSEWVRMSTKFEEYLAGKSRVIEQAQSGGKVFYRLRAHGFEDLSDARRFCSAILAGQGNCIPVVTR